MTSPSFSSSEKSWGLPTIESGEDQSPSFRAFTSPLISVTVGTSPSAVQFSAHKSVLERIPFFQKCLGPDFPEGKHGTVTLPEDDPEAFAQVLDYAYSGKITFVGFTEEVRTERERMQLMTVARTYILADKFCMEDLRNQVADEIVGSCGKRLASPPLVTELRDKGPSDGVLREFLLQRMAYSMLNAGWESICAKDSDYKVFFNQGGQDVEDFMRVCAKPGTRTESASLTVSRCAFHLHINTGPCGQKIPGVGVKSPLSARK